MEEQFTTKIKTVFKLAFEPKLLKALLSLRHHQYLVDIGWINSFKSKSPVDKNNNPIPWATYPFIDFITPRLNKNMEIFEFGSGNSTLFYASKVKSVYSIEHDTRWFNKLRNTVPKNVSLFFRDLNNKYALAAIESQKKFDIIIIDAEHRQNCIIHSVDALKNDGILVLDDSEREEYNESIQFLHSMKFKQLDFWGISPGILFRRCTSIFYHSENCLGV